MVQPDPRASCRNDSQTRTPGEPYQTPGWGFPLCCCRRDEVLGSVSEGNLYTCLCCSSRHLQHKKNGFLPDVRIVSATLINGRGEGAVVSFFPPSHLARRSRSAEWDGAALGASCLSSLTSYRELSAATVFPIHVLNSDKNQSTPCKTSTTR